MRVDFQDPLVSEIYGWNPARMMHRPRQDKNTKKSGMQLLSWRRSDGYTGGVIATLPIKTEKQNIAIAMERICPKSDRIVATMLDAMPRCLLSTELMMALVLGEENSA